MCKVSNKLKLCSCTIDNFSSLKHYWILRRRSAQGTMIVGEMMPPPEIGKEATSHNIHTLKRLLNNGTCFDADISPVEGDTLDLFFAYHNGLAYNTGHLTYSFGYKNGKWRKEFYSPFNHSESKQEGEILNAFERNPS